MSNTIGTITNTSGAPLAPMVVNVPPSAPKALPLRLRVSAAYNSYTTSCASAADAEFEDYTIYVSGLNVTDISPFTGCTGVASSPQTLVISARGLDPGSTVNITTLPTGYEISSDALLPAYVTDPNIFRFTPDINGNIAAENLYLRLSSSASNGDNGDLSFSATLSNGTPADPVVKNTGIATVISSPTQPGTISVVIKFVHQFIMIIPYQVLMLHHTLGLILVLVQFQALQLQEHLMLLLLEIFR